MSVLNNKCNECTEPTKQVIGFWDGENGTHGRIYDCKNEACEVKIMMDTAKDEDIQTKTQVQKTNEANNVDMKHLRKERVSKRILTLDMAKHLGISTATYSQYENEKVAIPKKIYEGAKKFIENV